MSKIYILWALCANARICFSMLMVMPGYCANDDALATKLVSYFPYNQDAPTTSEWIMYFDSVNGALSAVSLVA